MNNIEEPSLLTSTVQMTPRTNTKKTRAYLTAYEKRHMQNAYGEQAYILFDYLMEMVNWKNPDFSNDGLVSTTGWSLSKLRKTKKILVDGKMIIELSSSTAKGTKTKILYIGQDLVRLAIESEEERMLNKNTNKVVRAGI